MTIDVSTHTRDVICATTQSRRVPVRKRAIATRLFTLQQPPMKNLAALEMKSAKAIGAQASAINSILPVSEAPLSADQTC
jgi:hypothetical protein